MRKLKIIQHISMDGVIQTASGPGDDFPYGDWTAPYRSPAGLQLVTQMYKVCELLLGRRTYDTFARFWPSAPKSPMADVMNTARKYVVTHRPDDLEWGPAEAVTSDFVEGIRRIKGTHGSDLILPGSISLVSTLLDHGLADEVVLMVNPVVLGKGRRLFESGLLPRAFALATSMAMPSGILVNTYKLIPTLAEEAVARARLEREIEIAREVQERLFPQVFPCVEGVDMAARCRPAQAVGGDYYDLIAIHNAGWAQSAGTSSLPCDRLGIAMGDISGKGISAALLMASLHASLRGQLLGGVQDLGAKMANVSRLLYDASASSRYATFFYAELDCSARLLHYVNGGHNPPVVLRKHNGEWQVIPLTEGGPVVGLLEGATYSQHSLQLAPGDLLMAFTDGISEAMNAAGTEWGEDRLIAEAQAHADLTADALLQHLFHAADAHAAGAPQHDDMTLMVLKIADA